MREKLVVAERGRFAILALAISQAGLSQAGLTVTAPPPPAWVLYLDHLEEQGSRTSFMPAAGRTLKAIVAKRKDAPYLATASIPAE